MAQSFQNLSDAIVTETEARKKQTLLQWSRNDVVRLTRASLQTSGSEEVVTTLILSLLTKKTTTKEESVLPGKTKKETNRFP